ncbi:hypothetical protein HK102_008105, partial [Quaeritorhiza haematococci]
MSLSRINDDVLARILIKTPWPEMKRLCQTSQGHYQTCRAFEEYIYREKIQSDFGLSGPEQVVAFLATFIQIHQGTDATETLINTLGFTRNKHIYELLYHLRHTPQVRKTLVEAKIRDDRENSDLNDLYEWAYQNARFPLDESVSLSFLLRLHKLLPLTELFKNPPLPSFDILTRIFRMQNRINATRTDPLLTPAETLKLLEWFLDSYTREPNDDVLRLFAQQPLDCSRRVVSWKGNELFLSWIFGRLRWDFRKPEALIREFVGGVLVHSKPDLNATDSKYRTVMVMALDICTPRVILDLLNSGLQINLTPYTIAFGKSTNLVHKAIEKCNRDGWAEI